MENTWISRNGKQTLIEEMNSSHLLNAIEVLNRESLHPNSHLKEILIAEATNRGLFDKTGKDVVDENGSPDFRIILPEE